MGRGVSGVSNTERTAIRFDAEEFREKERVARCRSGAINLNRHAIGRYDGCNGCPYQPTASISGCIDYRFKIS